MRRIILLAVSASLSVAPAATAAPPDLTDPSIIAAVSAGEQHWPENRCAGRTTYRWQPTASIAAEIGRDATLVLAYAALSGAYEGDCTVTLNSDFDGWTPSRLCAVVAHEHGHLLGLDHSDQPGDLMYPVVHVTPPSCPTDPAADVQPAGPGEAGEISIELPAPSRPRPRAPRRSFEADANWSFERAVQRAERRKQRRQRR